MKLFFDHIAGKTESCEIIYSPACAIFETYEYEAALENGWSITTNWYHNENEWFLECLARKEMVWYQSRTSRLKVDEFKLKSRHRKRLKKFPSLSVDVFKSYDIDVLMQIYQKYLKHRGYVDMYGDMHPFKKPYYGDERYIIVFYEDKEPIAFSIQDVVGRSAVALQFCWDYVNPTLGIGTINKYVQLELMKELGVEFMYLGTSYESNSVKKADYPGFQWWNGRMWSNDRDEYVRLCHEETKAKTLIDVSDLQFQYFAPRKNT
tara:strand:- start:15839 stop:16627 length:789 start_codon:yes stop_codon:yes gene_type:complete